MSAGQTSIQAQPVYGRMFQTPFADRIRNEIGIATMAVGNITEPDHVNAIIAAGRADLCALARPHLSDPHFALRAAAGLGYADQWWPKQYLAGKAQIERLVRPRGHRLFGGDMRHVPVMAGARRHPPFARRMAGRPQPTSHWGLRPPPARKA